MNFLDFRRIAISLAALLLVCFAIAASPEGGYHLLKKYDLGAAPGGKEYWDYITFAPPSRRLYISHNTEVKVVEADTGKIVGSIGDLKRVHGIALVSHLGKGFISDGGADEAVVFDFGTDAPDKFSVVETIKTEFGARDAALDPRTQLHRHGGLWPHSRAHDGATASSAYAGLRNIPPARLRALNYLRSASGGAARRGMTVRTVLLRRDCAKMSRQRTKGYENA